MVILKIIFKQDLAFFGAAEVIMAMIFLWGFTRMITPTLSAKQRGTGLLVAVAAVLVAAGIGIVGYRTAAEYKA